MTELLPSSMQVLKNAATAGARGIGTIVRNFSVATQAVTAAVATYITGTQLKVPDGGLQVGSKIRFRLKLSAATLGTATSTYSIVFGTAGTVADTARVSFTKIAGTNVADVADVLIEATVRSVSATGVVVGNFTMSHNLAATGFATLNPVNVLTTSAAFDNDGQDLYIGLVVTTGASDAVVVEQVEAELIGPS